MSSRPRPGGSRSSRPLLQVGQGWRDVFVNTTNCFVSGFTVYQGSINPFEGKSLEIYIIDKVEHEMI